MKNGINQAWRSWRLGVLGVLGVKTFTLLAFFTAAVCHAGSDKNDKVEQALTHKITGLCYPERADELRALLKDNPKIKLVSIDYARAEATFAYIPKEHNTGSLGHVLGAKGFGIKTPSTTPPEKLTTIEIPVAGLDCKGCSLGAYFIINKIAGVEQATVSFKEGRIVALIDPEKTNQADLEAALKKADIVIKKTQIPAKAP